MHKEYHPTLGAYIKDFIYGANDGIITTFAIVMGAAGADFSPLVVIILGFANLFADGFSMAASNYLGSSSEAALFQHEEKREIEEVEQKPDVEREEVENILVEHGFNELTAKSMTTTISSNKNFWVDFMMRYEIEMLPGESSIKAAIITFFAFVFIGSLPLLPFVFISSNGNTILYSIISTSVALFATGASRSIFTKKHWLLSGLEMFLIGGVASAVSYFVGYGLNLLIGAA